jgi:plasmid stability protein
MAGVVIRDVDATLLAKLRARAKAHGRSLEAEVTAMLEAAAMSPLARILQVRKRFAGRRFSDSAVLIRRDRAR